MSREDDIRKANRKGSREAELEDGNGWSSKDKIHKNKRKYRRNNKHKNG